MSAPATENAARPCIERLHGAIFCTLRVGHDGDHVDSDSQATWPRADAGSAGSPNPPEKVT